MYCYCLFCETGKCDFVAHAAMQAFPCRAISPKQIQHTWSKGETTDRVHDLLPGYVFLYSEEPMNLPEDIRKVDRIIRCLRDTSREYALKGQDEEFARMIYRKDGIIGKTEVTEKDGRFTIADETFRNLHAEILKVDRRNRRMKIEILFTSNRVQTWVEYEIISSDAG